MTYLVYDGECPFCSQYAAFMEARKRLPDLQLVDARTQADHQAVLAVKDAGLVLDDGMALVRADGTILHGADAVQALAAPGSLLASGKRAGFAYPFLKAGRNAALKVLGRKKLGY